MDINDRNKAENFSQTKRLGFWLYQNNKEDLDYANE